MTNKIISASLLAMLGLPALADDVKTIGQGGAGVAHGDFTYFLTNPAHLASFGEEDEEAEEVQAEADATVTPDPALATDAATPTDDAATPAEAQTDAPVAEPTLVEPTEQIEEVAAGKAGIGFGFSISASAVIQDEKDLIGNVEDVADVAKEFEDLKDTWTYDLRDKTVSALEKINGGYISAKVDASSYIAVPNTVIPMSVFVNSSARAAGTVDVSAAIDTLEHLVEGVDDVEDLFTDMPDAYAAVSGIWTTDIGLSLAHVFKFKETSALKVGASFKYQQVTLYDYKTTIDGFEEDGYKDADTKDSGVNIDLGVSYTYNNWLSVGFVAENLISQDYEGAPLKGETRGNIYEMKPQYTFGVGVKYGIVSLMADVELVENPGFSQVKETQYANIGAKFDFWRQASISLGYQMDMKNNEADLFCVGIGISPGDVVSLDLVGMIGTDSAYGAGVRLGIKF